jgi:hypothetical protein
MNLDTYGQLIQHIEDTTFSHKIQKADLPQHILKFLTERWNTGEGNSLFDFALNQDNSENQFLSVVIAWKRTDTGLMMSTLYFKEAKIEGHICIQNRTVVPGMKLWSYRDGLSIFKDYIPNLLSTQKLSSKDFILISEIQSLTDLPIATAKKLHAHMKEQKSGEP